jgi:opacity protein-like surface antigen
MRPLIRAAGLAALTLAIATPASAQVVQAVQVGFGAFLPRGFDSRVEGDTLVENLSTFEPLAFEVREFRNVNVFGEWIVAVGDYVEGAAGIGYYGKTVPSVYRNLVDADGSEIEQDLRLRIIPISGVVRFLPFGRAGDFQPYVGAGVTIMNWRYSEVGEFVDTVDFTIFPARFVASGTTPGGLVLGGIRIPIQGDIYALTAEYRYQFGSADTGGADEGFLGDKIDLSGGNFNVGFLVRF